MVLWREYPKGECNAAHGGSYTAGPMFLSTLRSFNSNFGIVAVLGYLGLFVASFLLMFLFPLGALALVFVGIFGLVVVVPLSAGAQALERAMNRRRLAAGSCPMCEAGSVRALPEEAGGWECPGCGTAWTVEGSVVPS